MRGGLVTVVAVKAVAFAAVLSAFDARVDDLSDSFELIKKGRDRIGQIDQQVTTKRSFAIVANGDRSIRHILCGRIGRYFVRYETALAKRP